MRIGIEIGIFFRFFKRFHRLRASQIPRFFRKTGIREFPGILENFILCSQKTLLPLNQFMFCSFLIPDWFCGIFSVEKSLIRYFLRPVFNNLENYIYKKQKTQFTQNFCLKVVSHMKRSVLLFSTFYLQILILKTLS